jgi:hypothetical protein
MTAEVRSLQPLRRGGARWTTDNPPLKITEFVQWLTEHRRQGEGAVDYARQAGYSPVTVSKWMHDPRVIKLIEAALEHTVAGPLPYMEVLQMLHRRAVEDEDVKAAGLYLQAVGRMAPRRTEVDVRVTDARTLSNDELQAELKRAVALLEHQAELQPGTVIEDAEVIEDDGLDGPLDG